MTGRTTAGYATADMLRGGIREQYATIRSYGTVVVEIAAAPNGWLVNERVTNKDEAHSTSRSIRTLDEARREYRRLVRKHR